MERYLPIIITLLLAIPILIILLVLWVDEDIERNENTTADTTAAD